MSKINGMYYLGKGEVWSSILHCSTTLPLGSPAFSRTASRLFLAEHGKNRQVATGENPWKDVRGSFRECGR